MWLAEMQTAEIVCSVCNLLIIPNHYVNGIKTSVLITEAQRFMGDMILSVLYHMISYVNNIISVSDIENKHHNAISQYSGNIPFV